MQEIDEYKLIYSTVVFETGVEGWKIIWEVNSEAHAVETISVFYNKILILILCARVECVDLLL